VSAPPPGEADEEARYATLLEEVFIAERGTPFLLSAKDWTLIRGWRERGVPVDTAIRAIQETFEKRRARGAAGKISSVAYCANAVDERWELELGTTRSEMKLLDREEAIRSRIPAEVHRNCGDLPCV